MDFFFVKIRQRKAKKPHKLPFVCPGEGYILLVKGAVLFNEGKIDFIHLDGSVTEVIMNDEEKLTLCSRQLFFHFHFHMKHYVGKFY